MNFFRKKETELPNIKETLAHIEKLERQVGDLSKDLERLRQENRYYIKKIGLVRFNPFKELGGDQSFSVSLLDGEDSGVVITSLYTKEKSRIYAKPIEKGKSKYFLSAEEKKAIQIAKSNADKPEGKFNSSPTSSRNFRSS